MEERQCIKNTIYNEGTKVIEQSKVEENLRELGITIRLDSFVDQATEKQGGERHPRADGLERIPGSEGRAVSRGDPGRP